MDESRGGMCRVVFFSWQVVRVKVDMMMLRDVVGGACGVAGELITRERSGIPS